MAGIAYVTIETNKPGERVGLVKQGEQGYTVAKGYDDPKEPLEKVKALVAALNTEMEIPADVAQSAFWGSMFGWHVPAAQKAVQFFAKPGRKCACCDQPIPPMPGTISLDPHSGELSCTCGNTTGRDGFVACDENGIECEPAPGWDGRYLCQQCGATITLTEQQFKDAGLL